MTIDEQPSKVDVTHHLSPEIETLIRQVLRPEIALATATNPAPAPEPLVPWTFPGPTHRCTVTVFVDQDNQLRHVPVTEALDVPKTWRRIYFKRV